MRTIEITDSEAALLLAQDMEEHPGWASLAEKVRASEKAGH